MFCFNVTTKSMEVLRRSAYLSTTRVIPDWRDSIRSFLHSHRLAENSKCAVSGTSSALCDKYSLINEPIFVVLSVKKSLVVIYK